jgi:rubrerythrin
MSDLSPQQRQPEVNLSIDVLQSESSRRAFLAKLLGGAAAATAIAAAPASVFASTGRLKYATADIPQSDAQILNFALTLEHLEANFYTTAALHFPGGSYVSRIVRILRFDEQAHVDGLTAAIKGAGYTPVGPAVRYNFPKVFNKKHAFLNLAATLEDTGVHAYLGQAPNIKTPSILLTAAAIVTVEARHTGAMRSLLHRNPTDGPFDKGLTAAQILKIVDPIIGH